MCCHCDGNTMSAEDPYWYFTTETQEACVQLVKKLMKDLNIPASNVLRHADIVNKTCPAPYVKNNKYKTSWTWSEFKAKISGNTSVDDSSSPVSTELYRVRKSWDDAQSQLFAGTLDGAKNITDENPGYNVYDEKGVCVYPKKEQVVEDNTVPTITPAPTKTDKIWLGWTKRESGSVGFRQTNGDSGNANGKYQFDRRYALVPFMQYCVDFNSDHYSGFTKYISYGAGSPNLQGNQQLASLWVSYCDKYPKEFEALQDAYAYKYYYLEAKKYIKNLYGINMDNHSPAVKGSLFSMAIRSGALSGAYKFEGCTDKTPDEEMLRVAYGNYGYADANRWTIDGQYGDAINALKNNEYTVVSVNDAIEINEVKTTNKETEKIYYYRIAIKYDNEVYVDQKYAFEDKNRALAQIKAMSSEYKVFDPSGKQIYPKKTTKKKSTKKTFYRVQAGRYLIKDNATNMETKIRRKGFDVMIIREDAEYIVQLGLFSVKSNAENLAAKVKASGLPVAVVSVKQ